MKTTMYMTAMLLATVSTAAFAADNAQEFVTGASIGGMFEVESSKLAMEKSSNADVKDVAKQLVSDHEKANAKLKSTVAAAKVKAKPADKLDAKHQDVLDELKAASADDFDEKYIDAQEDAHDEAIALFEDYSASGDNAKLKQFATDTLPTLKMHKEHVETLDEAE